MFLIDYRAICVILCAPKSSHACPSLSPSPASKDQPGSGSSKTAVRHAPICAPRRRQACIACLGRRAVTSNRAYNCQYETCSATSPPRRGLSSPFNYLPEGTVEDGLSSSGALPPHEPAKRCGMSSAKACAPSHQVNAPTTSLTVAIYS